MTDNRTELDDLKPYRKLDTLGMLEHLHAFPAQCRRAYDLAMDFPLPGALAEVDKVVILGMGGSAIGGDLVSSIAVAVSRIPIAVCRGYDLPAYADGRTLVVASSYSGNTEETLSCFEQSVRAGCRNLVITTGGLLFERARRLGIPAFSFDYRSPPRAALPYSFVALLCFLRRLGLIPAAGFSDVEQMFDDLEEQAGRINEMVPEIDNPAKRLARRLYQRIPVIYGSGTVAEVAHRWKTQLNENSKVCAFYEMLPEMSHNAVVGYEFPVGLPDHVFAVMLRSRWLSPRLAARHEAVMELLKGKSIPFSVVDGMGGNPLAEMISLVLLGDYVSYYLALLNGVDPTPVKAIDLLKTRLADAGESYQ